MFLSVTFMAESSRWLEQNSGKSMLYWRKVQTTAGIFVHQYSGIFCRII